MSITMRDVLVNKVPTLVNEHTKVSGIMERALAIPASDNTSHKYKSVDSLPTFTTGTVGSSVTPQSTHRSAEKAYLAFSQAAVNPEAAVVRQMDDPAGYFREEQGLLEQAWLQHAPKGVIYGSDGTFGDEGFALGWHQIVKSIYDRGYTDVRTQKGGTTGSRTSLFIVKFIPGLSGVLYNDKVMSSGSVLDVAPMQAPGAVNTICRSTTTGAFVPGIGYWYSGYIGTVIAHRRLIAAITQIEDAADDRPTATDLRKALDYVNASSTDTAIFGSALGLRLVSLLKQSYMRMDVKDQSLQTRLLDFDSIPLYLDENISDAETTVLD